MSHLPDLFKFCYILVLFLFLFYSIYFYFTIYNSIALNYSQLFYIYYYFLSLMVCILFTITNKAYLSYKMYWFVFIKIVRAYLEKINFQGYFRHRVWYFQQSQRYAIDFMDLYNYSSSELAQLFLLLLYPIDQASLVLVQVYWCCKLDENTCQKPELPKGTNRNIYLMAEPYIFTS